MAHPRKKFRTLFRRNEGGSAVEFALLAPVLFLITFGIIDMGIMLLTWVMMEGGLREAARYAITGAPPTETASRLEEVIKIVEDKTSGLIDLAAARIEAQAYPSFDDVGKGESYVDAGDMNGHYDAGESFTDCNGNGKYDNDRGKKNDAGDSADVVLYTFEYDYKLLTPVLNDLIGTNGKFPLRASVLVRNEPWESGKTSKDKKKC
ncbi:MAG: pilus assembly protein [Defluviicoccus sp.]|nr:pilus assembly protein [Defluviicoccus sp.]MDG4591922.1 pilus assembly protein [Defluviicoccus sp.]MDS4009953.1 pilus assembly protein [Defluviicoccus sp.]MDS4073066.1 pilus assembly protein [Defluviicoccus sp.]